MQQPYTRLADVTAFRTYAKQLDRFFDVMARRGLRESSPDDYVSKATVTGITSTNDASLSEPAQAFGRVVLERSGFGKLLPLTVPTTPYARVPIPLRNPAATWVGQGHPVPLARASWAHVTTSVSKLCTIFCLSTELLRTADPRLRDLIVRQASRQLALALDAKFFSSDTATDSSPAGLLASAPQFGGGSPANVGRDLADAFAFVSDGRASAPVLVLSKRAAVYLATLDESLFRSVGIDGGNVAGIPVITSPAVGNLIVLVDADSLGTFDGGVEAQPSEVADVEMSDAPTNNAATGAGAQVVSMFQTGMAGIKLVQTADWRLLADDAIAYVELSELGGSPA